MWLPAKFLERPNRFIVHAALADGRRVRAHMADPGRLEELLLPGALLRLRPAAAGQKRKTRYSVELVRAPDPPRSWVSVHAARANRLAEDLLRGGKIRGIPGNAELRREVRCGDHRFDFRVGRLWVEVKSVTFAEGGIARFPDAPTERGRRHVEALTERAEQGEAACILFVAQREDVHVVKPYTRIDPEFTTALQRARRAGLLLRAVRFQMQPDGTAIYRGPVRVNC